MTKYDGPGGEVVIPKDIDLDYFMVYEHSRLQDGYWDPRAEYGKYGIFYEDQDESIHYCVPMPARKIGDAAFAGCDTVTSVDIPDSMTAIGKNTFSGCTALLSVSVPSSVTEIGQDAFSDCPDLTLVVTEGSFAHRYAIANEIALMLD